MPVLSTQLSISNHDRDRAGMRYVYPVVSRRAGGVSLGVNLNPNNACNWACVYCQVPELKRGGPVPIDLGLLERELRAMLNDIVLGDFMARQVPPEARRLMDIAFSGNGEPTSAPEFPDVVALVLRTMDAYRLEGVKLRLITNGSLVSRRHVQAALTLIGEAGGEVWFKLDAADAANIARINRVRLNPAAVLGRLRTCSQLAPTWVQTCVFAMDGKAPDELQVAAYLSALAEVRHDIRGVLLYGLARPSMQDAAPRLSALAPAWLDQLAERICALGLSVQVSP